VARGARGAYRDALSSLDQLAAATGGTITVQDVLQLLGTVEEEALFRLCDLVVDRDTAGALTFVEELAEQGQDLGRLVTDLIEHLRHLLLVQHMGEVPESLPVTEEARERLRAQANQLGEPTVIRLLDLLAVAVDDMRQGADPRLPLELAVVKVTRPAADLSRESLAYRLEQLESRGGASAPVSAPPVRTVEAPPSPAPSAPTAAAPGVELEQLQEAWARTIVPAVAEKSIPTSSLFGEARPADLEGDTLTVEFPPSADFHRKLAEDPKNSTLLRDALYEVTGRRLAVAFALGEDGETLEEESDEPVGEEKFLELLKETFDARERETE
jgi:DNA polymerase-3 subunit gamma/tau